MAKLSDLFNLYALSTGRSLFAASQIQARADDYGDKQISKLAGELIKHAREVHKLETAWNASNNFKPAIDVRTIDIPLDRLITNFRDLIATHRKSFEEGDPQAELLAEMEETFFPGGVQAITSLPWKCRYPLCEMILPENSTASKKRESSGLKQFTAEQPCRAALQRSLPSWTKLPSLSSRRKKTFRSIFATSSSARSESRSRACLKKS